MAGYKPMANQKNVVTPSNGNSGVRPMASKGASGGCKSCGR